MEIKALLITLLSGFAFFLGYFITKLVSKGKKLVNFSIGFSFAIILGIAFTDLLPECFELIPNKLLVFVYMICGLVLLKILDLFIPDHHHEENASHIEHIGLISAFALFLHNIIEGTAIYTTCISDVKTGILMAVGVAFHNIPLGIQISSLVQENKPKICLLSALSVSSIFLVVLLSLFNVALTEYAEGVLICITFGMLIYISIFELLHEVIEHIKHNEVKLGLLIGIILIIAGMLVL